MMQSTSVFIVEIYALLMIMNAALGIVTGIYHEEDPANSLRSPFNAFPLGSNFTGLDTETTTDEMIAPTNSTGDEIPWWEDALSNFEAMITAILTFVSFFTAGFVIQLLNTMGFPGDYLLLVTVPMGLYVMYTTFVMITNRLGN